MTPVSSPSNTLVLCLLLASLLLGTALSQAPDGSVELRLGVQAYKDARYDEAVQHFERAVAVDPASATAHLYLATACAQQYIPGVGTPENIQSAQAAVTQYKRVLELDPPALDATKGIAYLNLQMKAFDVAKEYYQKASQIDPTDPENYDSIGVIDWTQTYQPRMETRTKLGLKPDHSMIAAPECWEVRDTNRELVADGIEMLKKAIDLRHDYDDALAYMNLMYRERADIQCSDPKANASDLRMADKWVDMVLAIKKRKVEAESRKAPSTPSTLPSPQ